MVVRNITENDKNLYNNFVAQNSGSFLQSWDWGKWQKQNGRQATRYIVADDNSNTVLSAQFILHPLPLGQYYLYCPYGPVLKVGMKNEELGIMICKLLNVIKMEYPNTLFIRLESTFPIPYSLFPIRHTSHTQPGKTLTLDLTKNTDTLLREMHPKTRYNIKLAEKHGVRIVSSPVTGEAGRDVDETIALITNTSSRHGYRNHSFDYLKNLFLFLTAVKKGNKLNSQLDCILYSAYFNKELLASGLFIDFANTRTYLFGGSSDEHKNIMAPYLLHWQALQDAKAKGLTAYDFWGIETSSGTTPGFVRFKLGFGGTQVEYPQTFDMPLHKNKYFIYHLVKKLTQLTR